MQARGARVARRSAKAGETKTHDKMIGAAGTVSSVANAPVMMEFAGMGGGWALGGLAGLVGLNRAHVAIKSTFSAPFLALRELTWGNLGAFRAHYWKAVHELAQKTLGAAKENGKTEIVALAEARVQNAAARMRDLAHTVKPVPLAVETAAGDVRGVVGQFSQWRAARNVASHGKHLDRAITALTEHKPGFFAGMWQRLTGKTPTYTGMHSSLSGIAGDLTHAKSLSGAALANHMQGVNARLGVIAQAGHEGASQAQQVLRFANKATRSASAAHGYAEAAKNGIAGLGAMVAKVGGRLPVFGTLVAIGTTATIGATWLKLHRQHSIDAEVLRELATDLGGANPEYIALVKRAAGKHTLSNLGTTGLSTVGEVASGAMIAASQQGMMSGGMMAAGFLPMVVGEPVKENIVLAAYQALGNPDLTAEQRTEAIKHLVAIKPSVAEHGGLYNRLNAQVSKALAESGKSRPEIVRLVADDKAFTAFASEVSAKQKATETAVLKDQPVGAKPEIKQAGVEGTHTVQAAHTAGVGAVAPAGHAQGHQAAPQATHTHTAAHHEAAHKAEHGHAAGHKAEHVTPHHEAANAPSMKVGRVEHKGHLAERQLAVANG